MYKYPIFSMIGVEIEYMLVDKNSLQIRPLSDLIFKELSREFQNEVNLDNNISISNELVAHVIELKNTTPVPPDTPLATKFYETILILQPVLKKYNLALLPTGAHPWMNPKIETKLWPHTYKEIYAKFDEIFNCNNHGWSNLQSIHLNLPFKDDEEFCKLHNAIRLILPLLPAIAASSPFLEGRKTGFLDTRLNLYEANQKKIPTIAGEIIPEFIKDQTQYENDILTPMYKEISPFDTQGILQYEWLNSRGAIAKFEQGAIEIRILDTQECVQADFAIIYIVIEIIKDVVHNSKDYLSKIIPTKELKSIYDATLKNGFAVNVENFIWLEQLNLPPKKINIGDIWTLLIEKFRMNLDSESVNCLEQILEFGNLSERMLKAYAKNKNLKSIYYEVSKCFLNNKQFNLL